MTILSLALAFVVVFAIGVAGGYCVGAGVGFLGRMGPFGP